MPIFPKKEDPVSAAPLRDPEEERKEREAEERKQKLAEQKSSVWYVYHPYLVFYFVLLVYGDKN